MPPTRRPAIEPSPGSSSRHCAAVNADCAQPNAACSRICASASAMPAREEYTTSLPGHRWSNTKDDAATISCSASRLANDKASSRAVPSAAALALQARRKSKIQRHCAGSADGTKRTGLSRASKNFGRLASTAREAIGAT